MKKIEIDNWILEFFKGCDLQKLLNIRENYIKELEILNKVIDAKMNQWYEGSINENPEQ